MTFDEYWHALTRDKKRFTEEYELARGEEKPSRTTQTRCVLERKLRSYGLTCLVANVSSYPAQHPSLIPAEHRPHGTGYLILSKLFEIVRPRTALFHGSEAAKFAAKEFPGVTLDELETEPAKQALTAPVYFGQRINVFGSVHLSGRRRRGSFSKLEMKERMEAFAAEIHKRI
jgi:hypothetical protein